MIQRSLQTVAALFEATPTTPEARRLTDRDRRYLAQLARVARHSPRAALANVLRHYGEEPLRSEARAFLLEEI